MKGKIFIDTNILIYLFSDLEKEKRTQAEILVEENKIQMVWSTQVIQEFCFNMIKKYKKDPITVKQSLSTFDEFELVTNDRNMIENAINIQVLNKISFWDSLIISSALSSKCGYLLTEDLQNDQNINGLQIVNPFK